MTTALLNSEPYQTIDGTYRITATINGFSIAVSVPQSFNKLPGTPIQVQHDNDGRWVIQ